MSKQIDFKVKNKNDQELELSILPPSVKQRKDAQIEFNKTFTKVLDSGGLLRQSINKHMEDQGLWDDKREEKYKRMVAEINEGEKKLNKGGIKLSEAKEVAIQMQVKRGELQDLLIERNSLDTHSVEGQAQQSEFEHLLFACLVYTDSREPYYSNKEEFEDKKSEEASQEGSARLMTLMYGSTDDFFKDLPESKFLQKWKFADDKLRLVNKDGDLVDQKGRLINEEGKFIDNDGNFVDVDGNPLDEDGNYAFDTQPFLDDDGEPIEEEEKQKTVTEEVKPETVPEEDQSSGKS